MPVVAKPFWTQKPQIRRSKPRWGWRANPAAASRSPEAPEQGVGQQSRCARAKAHRSPRTPLGSSTPPPPPIRSPGHCRVAPRTRWAIDQSRKCPQGHLHNKGGPKPCLRSCKYQALSPAKRRPGREAARETPPPLRIPPPQLRNAFI